MNTNLFPLSFGNYVGTSYYSIIKIPKGTNVGMESFRHNLANVDISDIPQTYTPEDVVKIFKDANWLPLEGGYTFVNPAYIYTILKNIDGSYSVSLSDTAHSLSGLNISEITTEEGLKALFDFTKGPIQFPDQKERVDSLEYVVGIHEQDITEIKSKLDI